MPRWTGALLILLLALSLGAALTPLLLINPSSAQDDRDIGVGYELRRIGPWITLPALVLGIPLVLRAWRGGARWLGKTLLVGAFVALALAAYVSLTNLYEKMFRPLPEVRLIAAADAVHVTDDALVIGVQVGDASAAYPVDIAGYHHIVNDRLQGEPFVVTY